MKYAKRIDYIKPSGIRFVQKKIVTNKDVISFAAGIPDGDLFPIDEISQITENILKEKAKIAFQYGMTQGYKPLLELLTKRMFEKENIRCEIDNLIITTGSQQGIAMSAMAFVNKNEVVLTENPSYLGGVNACRPYGCRFVGVETDEDGMLMDDLEKKLQENPNTSLIYVIPNFQNPTGQAWSVKRRKKFMEVINKYDVVVVEDNPYGEISFAKDKLPSLKSLDTQGKVIYLGSFSKILCPGLRVAWMCADKDVITKMELLKQGIDLQCNEMAQMQVAKYLENYDIEEHINHIRNAYKNKCELMINEMKKKIPKYVYFSNPKGGMFIWLVLPEKFDATQMLDMAIENKVAYVPGEYFYSNENESKKNTMRLNFTGLSDSQIIEGVTRLSKVIVQAYSQLLNR